MFIRWLSFGPATGAKRPRRRSTNLRRVKYVWRRLRSDGIPASARRLLGPAVSYLDMLFIDHGVLRLVYVNQHRLGERAWRSGQPAPHHVSALARQGVRTIINLRGERLCGSYVLEKSACERHGIALINFKVRSRAAPGREEVKAAVELFERIEYPMLLHCKSGADRAGLMSVLYRFLKEGVPLVEAKRELSLRYGHSRRRETGILDHFFERYIDDNRRRPMPFLEWLDKVYDPEELHRSFRGRGNRLVDQVLGRE
jgi:protein tyrosine/serine phosphatase